MERKKIWSRTLTVNQKEIDQGSIPKLSTFSRFRPEFWFPGMLRIELILWQTHHDHCPVKNSSWSADMRGILPFYTSSIRGSLKFIHPSWINPVQSRLELLAVCIDSATLSTQINSDGREIIEINRNPLTLISIPGTESKSKKQYQMVHGIDFKFQMESSN